MNLTNNYLFKYKNGCPQVTDKMVALQVIEKKTVEAHAHVHAIALLLKEEHASAAALEAEVMATAL
jgi:hypothetical protein